MKPRVSVIIPTFGSVKYLPGAIESVCNQTYRDFEIILVDDNDPKSDARRDTLRIAERYTHSSIKFEYIQHDKNRNGSVARNTGVRASVGEYISFLDSDDWYYPKRLEKAVDAMDRLSNAVGGVYTGVDFYRHGKYYGKFDNPQSGSFLVDSLACRFRIGTGSNLFVRREAFNGLDGFDELFWRHQDYEFLVRFFEKYELAGLNEILVAKNNDNVNLPPFDRSLAIKRQFLQKFGPTIAALPASDQDYIMRANFAALGELALREGLRSESRRMYGVVSERGGLGFRGWLRRSGFLIRSWKK
jgi:glycosyltransferase involved in cell wall biosynthesis